MLKTAYAQQITVIHYDGSIRDNLKTVAFKQDLPYISINNFADLFNAPTSFDDSLKLFTIYLNKITIRVIAYNPFFSINDNIFQLPTEAIYKNGQLYVPMNYFLNIISKELPELISYDPTKAVLKIVASTAIITANIEKIDIEEKINGTLIVISTKKDFEQSDISLRARHRWLYLDIYGGKVDSASLYAEYKTGMIARIVPSQISNELAQISFRLRDEIIEKQYYLQPPRKIFLTIKTKKDLSEEIIRAMEKEKQKWLIDKIVIDPGHGGRDPGAIGPNRTYEKTVVLAIAKYLKKYIEKELGIEVLMTRETDKFVGLKQRTKFANSNQAKLFISIHANSNPDRRLRGVSTYFLGPDNNDEAREVAKLENSVIKYENESKYSDLSSEQYILTAGAQSFYSKESEDLAGMVQENLIRECGLPDRSVRQAGFFVLWGASMPNILIETAFISNPKDEMLLRKKSFQKKVAYSIFLSIKQFKEKYESVF